MNAEPTSDCKSCDSRYDVVVVGGGPAGSTAAAALSRRGQRVALIERSEYCESRIGEMLPPATGALVQTALAQTAGLLGFDAAAIPCPGVVSAWGSGRAANMDFLFHPCGHGWHLDRRRFDALLAGAAAAAGSVVLRGKRVIACQRCPSHDGSGWMVHLTESAGSPSTLRASMLVFATGRAAPRGFPGGRRLVFDRLVGVGRFIDGASDPDQRTLIEACADGWWYSARLPGGRHVATYMTDADVLPGGRAGLARAWDAWLATAPHTQARLTDGRTSDAPRIVAADTYIRRRVAGPGWVAVGDAASTHDPLSSQGIHKALTSGLDAAGALAHSLDGRPDALSAYAQAVSQEFERYLRTRAAYYGMERRWPDSPFWRRRQAHDPATIPEPER